MTTLFDMLDYGWPLAWDEDMGIVVTWNGSCTYNIWAVDNGTYSNIDVRTIDPTKGGHPVSMGEAADIAGQVINDLLKGEE